MGTYKDRFYQKLILMDQLSESLKPCPCCGNGARFGVNDGMSYKITCVCCGMGSPVVQLPTYYNKHNQADKKLIARLFRQAAKPWNNRNRIFIINTPLERRG